MWFHRYETFRPPVLMCHYELFIGTKQDILQPVYLIIFDYICVINFFTEEDKKLF